MGRPRKVTVVRQYTWTVHPPASASPNGVSVRDAATVMVVRDNVSRADETLEVFMLKRSLASAFVGGVHVFPGGGLDPADSDAEASRWCEGRSDASASEVLGVANGGLAYWVAAIRECFEEAGLLMAYDRDGRIVSFDDPDTALRFEVHRGEVDRGDRSLLDVCVAEGLRLAVDALHYFSHWITPIGANRRYDTRFFICAAPTEQVGLHDDRETVAAEWVAPAEALARHEAGNFDLISPTIKSLRAIARFATANELLEACRSSGTIPAVLPRTARQS